MSLQKNIGNYMDGTSQEEESFKENANKKGHTQNQKVKASLDTS